MTQLIIVGIDPSLSSTGISITGYEWNLDFLSAENYRQTTFVYLDHFGSKPKDATSLRRDRYQVISDGVINGLESFLELQPSFKSAHLVIGIELYLTHSPQVSVLAMLAELQGYLKGCIITRYILGHWDFSDFDMYEVHNKSAKKWITGNGGSDKKSVQASIKEKYDGLEIDNEDEADAFAIMRMIESIVTENADQEIIDKVKKF